ncbi:Phosphatidylinositol 4-phosphate 5-kinase its3 [Hypsizygus marmoreus]|uniref:1-phosphatidylinositol-4-phosphate 5-kinase n=1 Tax=Hypsizygus marmoreus TaxID=39966 RepID=A0A369K097_HYPMA|nr:Phosphatidylinositol 4-phosphate 5-kinase its3 [Hypsizygus marmoreus]
MASAAVLPAQFYRRSPSPIATDHHRLSTHSAVSSSATSFQTAPLSTAASSAPTMSPIHLSRQASQEVHIVKVTDDTVMLEKTTTVKDSYVTRIMAGPLPPSPPESIEHGREEPMLDEGTQTDSLTLEELEPVRPPRLHRASTETKESMRTIIASNPQQPPSAPSHPPAPPSTYSKSAAHLSSDGFLQPPPPSMHRPTRRNTTGSTPTLGASTSAALPGTDELESDIQLHADNIRRERLSKRAKLQQEAEAAMTREKSTSQDVPLVGNLIGEDHVNYVLMYNMLTGIRIGVSRCQAKIKRPLTDEDFKAKHKFSFDIVGNELTPSAKYDFKFKDYAPWVFRSLREDHFHLDPADYLLSLTSKYILSELGSPGKSGSFFYFSRDYRFIIKTIHHSEHSFLLRILPLYYEHVKANPHTLLSRFYGLHRVKLPRGRKIHFVIMNNIFPPHRDIHETYDLKGSTVGREYPEEKAAKNPRAVLKDLNWINRGRTLELGPEKRALLTEQLRRDAEFLKKVNVMDYSLLVGIHNMQRGNRDNVRRKTLKVFSPDIPPYSPHRTKASGHSYSHSHSSQSKTGSPEAIAMRRAIYRTSDPRRLDTIQLPDDSDRQQHPSIFIDRQHFIFYHDEGGLRATDEGNEDMDAIYYLGVIDILTPYTPFKKIEHFWKGLKADRHKISPVPPTEYSERFLAFMKAIMRGGEGAARFKAE